MLEGCGQKHVLLSVNGLELAGYVSVWHSVIYSLFAIAAKFLKGALYIECEDDASTCLNTYIRLGNQFLFS